MAWTPYPNKNNDNPVTIPSGWVTCDGSQITEGIWIGQNTPDLNGSKRFLRGGIISDALNMEDDTTSTKGLSAKSTSTASHNLDTQDYWYHGAQCPSGQDSEIAFQPGFQITFYLCLESHPDTFQDFSQSFEYTLWFPAQTV